MDCPVCRDAMITLELHDVEIDHCVACGGIWLDAGELELLLGDSDQATALLRTFRKQDHPKEALRKCPICLKKMSKTGVGPADAPVIIDACARRHGLWFDHGELDDILVHANLDDQNRIRRLLADMFGK
ncbi:MAG: zf-TFIIB domain-containing protein [Planctomycetes bacterium]|nr:zf-TFIIB domain-containing protein [Planctomycetota bacterium]